MVKSKSNSKNKNNKHSSSKNISMKDKKKIAKNTLKTINSNNKSEKNSQLKDSDVSEYKIDLKNLKYETTKDIPTPKMMIDQVVGQEEAVNVIKKAANQRRHVLLIGETGTGKSMLGMALAELLPKEKLVDVLSLPNANDENQPLIRTIAAGKGRELATRAKIENSSTLKTQNIIVLILAILAMVAPWWVRSYYKSDVMFAAFFLGGMMFLVGFVLFMNVGKKMMNSGGDGNPKVIVDNFDKQNVSFYDATGAHAGALLGDVLHDPFQSGGLGTPANERVVAGMIHKAHMGVLFIDEISTLEPTTQQDLLTAIQEGKYP
ncbi:MAG TPA: sigma 54-interacting transcriptional regulator, partial [Allocoleopsis sp.]